MFCIIFFVVIAKESSKEWPSFHLLQHTFRYAYGQPSSVTEFHAFLSLKETQNRLHVVSEAVAGLRAGPGCQSEMYRVTGKSTRGPEGFTTLLTQKSNSSPE